MESRWIKASPSSAWCALALVLIGAVGVINLVYALQRVPRAPHYALAVPGNAVMRQEQRFVRLRESLKPHHVRGTVGYLADLPPERMRENAAAMEELFLTQFVLVPVVLDAKVEGCSWVVTNLHVVPPPQRLPAGYRVVENFGDGVMLLRKEER